MPWMELRTKGPELKFGDDRGVGSMTQNRQFVAELTQATADELILRHGITAAGRSGELFVPQKKTFFCEYREYVPCNSVKACGTENRSMRH